MAAVFILPSMTASLLSIGSIPSFLSVHLRRADRPCAHVAVALAWRSKERRRQCRNAAATLTLTLPQRCLLEGMPVYCNVPTAQKRAREVQSRERNTPLDKHDPKLAGAQSRPQRVAIGATLVAAAYTGRVPSSRKIRQKTRTISRSSCHRDISLGKAQTRSRLQDFRQDRT